MTSVPRLVYEDLRAEDSIRNYISQYVTRADRKDVREARTRSTPEAQAQSKQRERVRKRKATNENQR